jgi:hypothetical protein
MADYMTDPRGRIWRVTGWWCRGCLYPLELPEDIQATVHPGCEVTD